MLTAPNPDVVWPLAGVGIPAQREREEAAMGASRIDDPWGPRTPFGTGAAWPARVDAFLADGVTPEQVERWVPSACVLCSNGCGLDS